MFHINRHKQYVIFRTYLFSFSLMFSGFLHICGMYQNSIPRCGWIMIHCTDRLHFAYLFIRGWTFKLFLPLPVISGAAVNIHVQVFKADSLKFFYDSLLFNSRISLGLNLLTVQLSVLLMALRLCLCPPPFICWINIFQDELSVIFSMTTGIAVDRQSSFVPHFLLGTSLLLFCISWVSPIT